MFGCDQLMIGVERRYCSIAHSYLSFSDRIVRTYAVVGFGEAKSPQDSPFPTGCGGRAPKGHRHNQWERRDFGGTYVPPNLPENADCISPDSIGGCANPPEAQV